MKYLLDDIELNDLSELIGKTLMHVSDKVGEFIVKDLNKKDMKIQNENNDKWYKLDEKYYLNFEIVYEIKPQMISPKLAGDVRIEGEKISYCENSDLGLRFVDYYVPFSHMTRQQVSYIVDRDIADYSENISSYRSDYDLAYTLSNELFRMAVKEIEEKLESKTVILVDLLGLFDGEDLVENNLVFIDAKTRDKDHLIIKATNESVKRKTTRQAKEILKRKYVLNEELSNNTEKNIMECYIFDDVYTKGNTIERIKELINEHNGFIEPHYHIVTYARTVRYKTNFLTVSDLEDNDKENVLFVCNKNMTRSILAEALARNEFTELNEDYNFYSVGIQGYAGREVCDHIYKYIVDHNLYDESLKPQRLSQYYDTSYGFNENEVIVDNDWLVVILDMDIVDLVIENYELEDDQYLVYDMPDVCKYTNPRTPYYENVEYLAEKLRKMIREVFINEE